MSSPLSPILLAEDSVNDMELTIAALTESGLANPVDWVRDGQEVLEYLRCEGAYANRPKVLPVVLLLDLKMPRVDGLQVLEVIKSHEELRMLPVVMLTSSKEERDVLRSYASGTNAYVVKPVDFDAFVVAMRNLGLFWAVTNQPPLPMP